MRDLDIRHHPPRRHAGRGRLLSRWTTSSLIAQKLDELGIDYIEGGWPGSNPKDKEFFARARDLKLKHAKLTAFGSTRFAKNPVEQDANVLALLDAATPVVSIFGKTWDLHVDAGAGHHRGGEPDADRRDRAHS